MAITEDKDIAAGVVVPDDLPLNSDTNTKLGVTTSQFALIGQRHVAKDGMKDTLYGAVKTGDTVVVGELTGKGPDVARPEPSGVTAVELNTTQNKDKAGLQDDERRQAAQVNTILAGGATEGVAGGATLLSLLTNPLANPLLGLDAGQLLFSGGGNDGMNSEGAAAAMARGDYLKAAMIQFANQAREENDHTDVDGGSSIARRHHGDHAKTHGAVPGATDAKGGHFADGLYYDAAGGHYDAYGYTFKDGSYKDVDHNYFDKKTNTITAGDTGAKIEVPKDLKMTGAEVLKHTEERLNGAAPALSAHNFAAPGQPPHQDAGKEAKPQPVPGSRWAHKVATEAEIRKQIQIEQEAQQKREAQFQAALKTGPGPMGPVQFKAVSADEAEKKIGFVHAAPAAKSSTAAATKPAAKTDDTQWYADSNGGYYDNKGGYYDNKGGYWDDKGGYTDNKNGYTDNKGGYTWPDGSYLDTKFNFTDKDGNLTTAQGDYYKARPGTDFKAALQDAANTGKDYTPPAMIAGDVPHSWKPVGPVEETPAPVSAKSSGLAFNLNLSDPLPRTVAPVADVPPPVLPAASSALLTLPDSTLPAPAAPAAPAASYSSLLGTNMNSFTMLDQGSATGSNFSLFNNFRENFDTPAADSATKFFKPVEVSASAPAVCSATAPAAASTSLVKSSPPAPAPKMT